LFVDVQKKSLPWGGLKSSAAFLEKLPDQKNMEEAVVEIAKKQDLILEAMAAGGSGAGKQVEAK
jgi:hypothetical protein